MVLYCNYNVFSNTLHFNVFISYTISYTYIHIFIYHVSYQISYYLYHIRETNQMIV